MVKKFLKSKSKRVPAAKRYKIEKKVREHNRKLKKIAKTKLKSKNRKNKSIHVPSDCPFKLQILTEAKALRDSIQEKKDAKKQEVRETRKATKDAAKASGTTENTAPVTTKSGSVKLNAGDLKEKNAAVPMTSFEELRKKAEERGYHFEKLESQHQNAEKTEAGQSDSSIKAFYREFQQVINESDVIIQVLDSRDPLGTRSHEAEELVRGSTDKKLLIVLNKSDLVPSENLQKWVVYLKQMLNCSVIPFKSNNQKQKDRLGSVGAVTNQQNTMETKKSVGVADLLGLLGSWARDTAGGLAVGVIGQPNVGKSSLINSLKRSKACNVGAKPGVTRACQIVQLDSKLRLIDSPGVCLDKNGKDGTNIETIVSRVPRSTLMLQYGIPEFQNVEEFLAAVAKKFGQIKKGGLPNVTAAEQKIIHDWHTGVIRFFTEPPEDCTPVGKITPGEGATILTSFSKPFTLENFTSSETMDEEMDEDSEDNDEDMESEDEEEPAHSKTKKKVSFVVNTDVIESKERKKLKKEFNDKRPHLQNKASTVGLVSTKKKFNKQLRKSKKKSTKKANALAQMVEDFNF